MDGVNIDDLTIEQYFMMTQGSQAPTMTELENMIIVEYVEYEEKLKRQHLGNPRFFSSTQYDYSDRKIQHHSENTKINTYHNLPPLLPYLGVNVNIMPKSMLKKLKLTKIKKPDVLVEMTDITKRTPLGIVENIWVKIDKFYFLSDFVVIDMEATRNETVILGSPFLAAIHAEIDIFAREITLGTEGKRLKLSMDNVDYDFASVNEKVHMLKVLPNNNLSDELTTHEFNY
ncbi:putative ribonuclease H-like domain-containing protein [Tanacetum coccineum]